jgi:uracil-DNA glycosylase
MLDRKNCGSDHSARHTHSTTQTFTRLFAAICLVVVGAAPEIGARVTDRPFHSEAAKIIIGIYEERKYIQLFFRYSK